MTSSAISSMHLRLLALLVLLLVPCPGSSTWDSEAAPPNSLPVTRSPLKDLPGLSDAEYHVVIGYGTPAQSLAMGFDSRLGGTTFLQCKPCGSACDLPAFDPSQSSSIAQVPCGSPDCPLKTCSRPNCTTTTVNNGETDRVTVVKDMITLSQTTMDNFRVNCLEMGYRTSDSSSGILDLSRDIHSLASRAPSSSDTVAFSYCLPSLPDATGFLSVGAPRPVRNVTYTALRRNTVFPKEYLVRLTELGLGGRDIPIPAGDAVIAQSTTFTYLEDAPYAALRRQFRTHMVRYRLAPPLGILDTCYDLTGLSELTVPTVALRFAGDTSLVLGIRQKMYFQRRDNVFLGCLAFAAPAWDFPRGVSVVIGTLAQEMTEVVYDVRAEKVGFVPTRCN